MSLLNRPIYSCAASALLCFGFVSSANSVGRLATEESGETPQLLRVQSPGKRICEPRISQGSGIQRGKVSQALLKVGNVACVEAQYGGELRVEVTLCDGREVELRGIGIERYGFANGRRRSSNPAVTYELIYKDTQSLPRPLGHGHRGRGVSFPAQSVTGVVITVPSDPGYNQINEQLCSIAFDIESP